ncbi:ATP-binding protein [Metabacillus fastidiosus]|uniref:ATP-binding protein n=1 Tax=Metabacillus fastidiosus TaxID=1458 RepID=UPI0008246780|nr:ATP-binding protein [Metabacillus fastidiosus]MED4461876.1 ATP-binding protein [Metabacillus fastidiosus]
MSLTQSQQIDFLGAPSELRIRKEILNICNSYSNYWDILAELCQNSVDAIRKFNEQFGDIKDHTIEITLDSSTRSIKIKDTGIGFPADRFLELLAPNGSDKTGMAMIGEKGVGLTYTIFSSNLFEIRTISPDSEIESKIENASLWKDGRSTGLPKCEILTMDSDLDNEPYDTYTEIILKDLDKYEYEEQDIFNQSAEALEFILRTKTVIGYLKGIFEERELNVKVNLVVNDIEGISTSVSFKTPKYMLPEDFIEEKENILDLDKLKVEIGVLSDSQKSKKLHKKVLLKKGWVKRSGRKINFYAFFASSPKFWEEISNVNELYFVDSEGNKTNLYESGIYIATKGMPTGIRLEPPITGAQSYWRRFYIILEDDGIVFDLGRKSVPNRTVGMLRSLAKTLFNEFLPFINYVNQDPSTKPGTNTTVQQHEKNKAFEKLHKIADLGLEEINYLKNPDGQEAAVVAIFHELIGAGLLKGYYGMKTGYKLTYDNWGVYRIDRKLIGDDFYSMANEDGVIEVPVIIEHKFKAEKILKEFKDNMKFFADIDLIVCWDLDENEFAKEQVQVEPLKKSEVFFYGSNYKLTWPGAYNLGSAGEKYVLSLRKFIEDYKNR